MFDDKTIVELQKILKDQHGIELSTVDAQNAGLRIVQFIYAKSIAEHEGGQND